MLTPAKKQKLINELKAYKKKYLDKGLVDLDESGTRLMINHFLCEVLGYQQIEEVKTEYMIKGTYADYMIQIGGIRHFLVEVKALSLQLSDKHLRQTVNYGANEGIEWAVLTNGKMFELHKILFNKPIDSRRIFSLDLSDSNTIKQAAELIQYLHRDAVLKKSLKALWNRCEALNTTTIAGILYSKKIIDEIKKMIKSKYGEKCSDDDVLSAINKIMTEKIPLENIKVFKAAKTEKKAKSTPAIEIPDLGVAETDSSDEQ
jgi:hypothetical protein